MASPITRPTPMAHGATDRPTRKVRDHAGLAARATSTTAGDATRSPGRVVDDPLPGVPTRDKASVRVRIVPHDDRAAGPLFGVRILSARAGAAA